MLSDAASAILKHADRLGLEPLQAKRGWSHMGGLITDASLQAGINYETVVLPRVRDVVAHWSEATTTSAFLTRLNTEDVAAVLRWQPNSRKLTTLRALTEFLHSEAIETTEQLKAQMGDSTFRAALRDVHGVGPKTVDYLSILAGAEDRAAVDVHLRAFVRNAGVELTRYDQVHDAIAEAARSRDWSPSGLDAAIWAHQRAR